MLRRDHGFTDLKTPLRYEIWNETEAGKPSAFLTTLRASLFRSVKGGEWAVVCPPDDATAYYVRYAWGRKWLAGRLRSYGRGPGAREVSFAPSAEPCVAGYVRGDRDRALLLGRGEDFVLLLVYLALERVVITYDPGAGRTITYSCNYPMEVVIHDPSFTYA